MIILIDYNKHNSFIVTTRERPNLPTNKSEWLSLEGLKPEEGAALLKNLGILGAEADLRDFAQKVEGHPLLLTLGADFLN